MEFGQSDWGDFVSRYTRRSQPVNRTPSPQHLLPEFESESQNLSPVNNGSWWVNEKKFCTEDNLEQCLAYLNQELSTLGYPSLFSQTQTKTGLAKSLNIVRLVNCAYELLEQQQQHARIRSDLEARQSRAVCDNENMVQNMKRIKDQLEVTERELVVSGEREKKQHRTIEKLQENIKTAKEEVKRTKSNMQHLQNQCHHDMRKAEGEMSKLKEKLVQLLSDKTREKKMGIQVLNSAQKVGGRRKTWNTGAGGLALESDVSRVLITSYEERQKELMEENNMLRESLRDMQAELMNLVNVQNESSHSDSEVSCSSDEGSGSIHNGHYHMPFETARNEIEGSWKEKCRVLREILENSKSSSEGGSPQQDEETEKLKQEVEDCKHIILQQELLIETLQQQNSEKYQWTPMDDSNLWAEKKSMDEERKLFHEQQVAFEKERNNFTMTAIQLEKERKKFEEERAEFFKQQIFTPKPTKSNQSIRSFTTGSSHGSSTVDGASTSSSQTQLNAQPQRVPDTDRVDNQDTCRRLSAGKEKAQVLNDLQHNSPEMTPCPQTPFNAHLMNSGPIRTPTTEELYKTLSLQLERNSALLETPRSALKENTQNNVTFTKESRVHKDHTPRRIFPDRIYTLDNSEIQSHDRDIDLKNNADSGYENLNNSAEVN